MDLFVWFVVGWLLVAVVAGGLFAAVARHPERLQVRLPRQRGDRHHVGS